MKEYGVTYAQADLKADGTFDYDAIRSKINERTKLITIQRSKGYATRPSFSVEQIGELIRFCKEIKPDVKVMVDNCYGEFVERIEPSDMGADMVVGSLIKNPGGGLAPHRRLASAAPRSAWSGALTGCPPPVWGRRSAQTWV